MLITTHLRQLLAAGGLVYNPYFQLQAQIISASTQISSYFDDIDSALDDGDSIKEAVRGKRLRSVMDRMISSSRLTGFQDGAKHTKKRWPASYGSKLSKATLERATEVNRLMKRTTRKRLRITPDSDHVLSKDRAIAAARYEAANAYFAGVHDAFTGGDWDKSWITSSGNSCQDCEDNEDQGPINVDEDFQSDDPYPAAHLNCSCSIVMTRARA